MDYIMRNFKNDKKHSEFLSYNKDKNSYQKIIYEDDLVVGAKKDIPPNEIKENE